MDWGDADGVAVVAEDHVDVGLPEHGADAEHGVGIDAEHDVDAENDADAEDDEPEDGGAGCSRPLTSVAADSTRPSRSCSAFLLFLSGSASFNGGCHVTDGRINYHPRRGVFWFNYLFPGMLLP